MADRPPARMALACGSGSAWRRWALRRYSDSAGDVMEEPERQQGFRADRRLEYRSAEADRRPVNVGQVIGGVIFSMLLVMGGAFLGAMASSVMGSGAPFFIVAGVAVLFCNGWAYVAYRDPEHRWLGV